MSSPADRLAAVAPFVKKYAATCPRITSAENISQAVDLLVRQKMFDSGGRIDYRTALAEVFQDRALARAYGES